MLAGTLPPQPPPPLAAALSAGLLPCLERLVRRAGEGPSSTGGAGSLVAEERLVSGFLRQDVASYLPWLLAYGSPTEAAALITSMGKLMRTAAAARTWTACQRLKQQETLVLLDAAHVAALTLAALDSWVQNNAQRSGSTAHRATGAAAAAAAESGPAAQLRRMAVLAACEWLPVLSTVVIDVAEEVLLVTPGTQVGVQHLTKRLVRMVRLCVHACALWLQTDVGSAGVGPAGPSTSTSAPEQAAAAGVPSVGALGAQRLRLLAREVRVVELLGAGMRLEAHARMAGLVGTDENDRLMVEIITGRLLHASAMVAMRSPDAVQRALELRLPDGRGFPAQCTWSSGIVSHLLQALPVHCNDGEVLWEVLEAWEGGREGSIGMKDGRGCGLLEVLEEEVQQPSPLRRCSWWRCTNLAGDSEAGLPLRACARCGGAWYCSRDCQAAHWREGHRGECGGTGGQG